MSQTRALLLVTLAWASIYLPGLGSREIKGEEGRRILPAVTMLQTGNFLVPQVGSEPYFRKPPLVNWLVAGSFKLFGVRNEWTARIPSAFCVLLVALAFVTIARSSLGTRGSLGGALVWLTCFGIVEKGRLIEIEALYVSLTGLAVICWLACWQTRRSPWLTWIVPWFFLGLGWLAKGPLHLVFFYAILVAVLHREGKLRALWDLPHFLGIAFMFGVFAAWAIPCLLVMNDTNVLQTWTRQFSGRVTTEDFKFSGWILNIPRGLGYFLPWVVLLPLVLIKRPTPNVQRSTSNAEASSSTLDVGRWTLDVQRAFLWAIAISFLAISLLPGALPRYTMPLLVPACWIAAIWLREAERLRLPILIAATTGIAMVIYAVAIIPQINKRPKVRNLAAEINTALPPAAPLYAINPDYQPLLFYVREPIIYVDRVDEVPRGPAYLLLQPELEDEALARWSASQMQQVLRLRDYRAREVILLHVSD